MKRGMALTTSLLAVGAMAVLFAASAGGTHSLASPQPADSLPTFESVPVQAAQASLPTATTPATLAPAVEVAQALPTATTLLIIPRETTPTLPPTPEGLHPLTLEAMRQRSYPGSDLLVEAILDAGSNYDRYIASYRSEGYKINGLLTIPRGDRPTTGWPAIIFNHGYIPPTVYRTTERYVAYQDAFARSGYVTFKPDYRGHGSSEGPASGAYGSPDYVVDVLNAFTSVSHLPDVDPARMGMWGHSMGGYITLRAMVINPSIRAGVIWAGVVASYPDMLYNWRRSNAPATPTPGAFPGSRRWRQELVETYGSPEQNPAFWASISANSYLADLSGPVQLHHGTADHDVPVAFSQTLAEQIQQAGREAELYLYAGDDHNIATNLGTALSRSVAFFDKYVKGTG